MLNKKILSYKTNRLVKKHSALRANVGYKEAKTIGIIFSIDDMNKHEAIKKFIKQLKADGKNVNILAYLPKGKHNFEFLFDFFTSKDVTFWGNYSSKEVNEFVKKQFDYLFYIDRESNPVIRNILAMSPAKCRIGHYQPENEPLCEMMVQTQNGNIDNFVDEIYKYTKILS